MSSAPDLFVVCKQCGSEVSPYITECPYCGHRLRRRAPDLPRGERVRARGGALRACACRALARSRRAGDGVGARCAHAHARVRREASLRLDSLPYVTIALVVLGCAGWVAACAGATWTSAS